MFERLRNQQARRQFLVVSTLCAVVALGTNLLLVQSSMSHSPTALNVSLQQVSAGIFSGAVTAAFLTVMVSWLLGKEEILASVQVLDPIRTQKEVARALDETDFWFHLGHSGGWVRMEALSVLSERARISGRRYKICLIIVDPNNAQAREAYTAYVRHYSQGNDSNIVTVEQALAEILATTLCAVIAPQRFPAVEVSLFFAQHFSSSRLDIASSVAFVSLVDPRMPALVYYNEKRQGSPFYNAALNDFDVMRTLSTPFRPVAEPVLPLTNIGVRLFLEANNLPGSSDERFVDEVIRRVLSTSHPYR